MMFTTPMTQLFAVVLRKDKERVTEALLREGVMQFVTTSEIAARGPDQLSDQGPEGTLAEVSELRKRIEGVIHTIGVIPSAPTETDLKNRVAVEIEKEKSRLDKIDAQRDAIRERQRSIQQEILKLEDIRRQMELYGVSLAGVKLPARQSMLSLQAGKLPLSSVRHLEAGLEGLPALHLALGQDGDWVHVLLISMKRDRGQIDKVLSGIGWTNVDLPSELLTAKKDLFEGLSSKLQALTEEQRKLQGQVANLIGQEAERLKAVWVSLRVEELCFKIQANFESSSRAVVFAGWLPSSKTEILTDKITEATEGRCYLEWYEAGSDGTIGEDVPVQLENPKILAPFQMLVSNFGIPQYGTIDPTPFVMPIYLAMFGLMFADVGQGLILAILGAMGARLLKGNEAKKGLYQLSWLISWCGLSAVVFGALLGSYFGMALFKPLWFDFHGIVSGHSSGNSVIKDVYDILAITIYFGISVIAVGLLFNWINIIRTKKWMELVFDKGGILGGWIYGGGIYIASYMISHDYKGFPSRGLMFLLVGLPSLLLFVKEPYHFFQHRSAGSEKQPNLFLAIPGFLMEWVVELLEIFSGYLSNTLSFMRVAGLGIAHVCLMISFFTLAGMTSGVFSILILVLGNLLVIGLEGLSAGVQALRLNYYEFFTKFFHGTGRLHTPISLRSEV
jgi:V/A-type H+-transporting ATPase subunit I